MPALVPPCNFPHFTCFSPQPLQSLGVNLSSGLGSKKWNFISQEEIKWYAGMWLHFRSALFVLRAPEQWLSPCRDVPSLAAWSARGIMLKGPKVSYRYVKSLVILAAGWGASLPLGQLAALCDLTALLLERRAAWIFSAIRCICISRSEVAQNARVGVLGLGLGAAGITQDSDGTDLRSQIPLPWLGSFAGDNKLLLPDWALGELPHQFLSGCSRLCFHLGYSLPFFSCTPH